MFTKRMIVVLLGLLTTYPFCSDVSKASRRESLKTILATRKKRRAKPQQRKPQGRVESNYVFTLVNHEGKDPRMHCKRTLGFLTAMLLFVNCAGKPGRPSEPDKISGSLTINGKTENLTHVYARRLTTERLLTSVYGRSMTAADLTYRREHFVMVFTNRAVPEDAMAKVLEDYHASVLEQDFLPDKSIRGVVFVVTKTTLPGLRKGYDGHVINAGRAYTASGYFDEFSMQKGRMRGKTSVADYDGSEVGIYTDDQRKFTCKFSVAFEVTPQGKPIHKEFEGAVSPDIPYLLSKQGTAEGSLTVDDKTVDLKYAYALRKREFFDEPEEHIKILATDQPLSDEVLVEVLYKGMNPTKMDIQGVILHIYTYTSKSLDTDICHKKIDTGIIGTGGAVEGLSITRERITAKTSEAVTAKLGHDWNYSMSVDVPFER